MNRQPSYSVNIRLAVHRSLENLESVFLVLKKKDAYKLFLKFPNHTGIKLKQFEPTRAGFRPKPVKPQVLRLVLKSSHTRLSLVPDFFLISSKIPVFCPSLVLPIVYMNNSGLFLPSGVLSHHNSFQLNTQRAPVVASCLISPHCTKNFYTGESGQMYYQVTQRRTELCLMHWDSVTVCSVSVIFSRRLRVMFLFYIRKGPCAVARG